MSSESESERDRDREPPPGEKAPEAGAAAPDPGAASSGSIDVAITGERPAATAAATAEHAAAGASGSIDVVITGERPAVIERSAGERRAASATEPPKSRRLGHAATDAAKEALHGAKHALEGGVSKLGSGMETLGGGISRLGERSHKVPLVGAGVSAIGEGITTVGESLTDLPRVARTRRGRLLLRSTILGFLLVFAWIAVIVALQVRGIDAPDFRPTAEQILKGLSEGSAGIEQVYETASPRFHEMVRKDRFIDTMTDMAATIGAFREITAINESVVTTGPTGRVGRVSLTVAYEKGKARASVSLHWDKGRWKLLGVGVDVPPELKITKAQREERVQACKDPMDPKKCDLYVVANGILEQLRDGKAEAVWENATKIFQKQEEKARFAMLHAENAATLGEYRRILSVAEAKLYTMGTIATFDVVAEYAKTQGVRATFGFYRRSRQDPWKLRSLKIVVPMPRADETAGSPGSEGAAGSAGSASEGAPIPPPAAPPPAAPAVPGVAPGAAGSSAPAAGSGR